MALQTGQTLLTEAVKWGNPLYQRFAPDPPHIPTDKSGNAVLHTAMRHRAELDVVHWICTQWPEAIDKPNKVPQVSPLLSCCTASRLVNPSLRTVTPPSS
jgi:hypothetical protein